MRFDCGAHRGYGDNVFMDEVFVRIRGEQRYLWRAIDQDGEVVDVLLQERRDAEAAKRFFRSLLARHGGEPRTIVTDKLKSYTVARRELIPESIHDTSRTRTIGPNSPISRPGCGNGG